MRKHFCNSKFYIQNIKMVHMTLGELINSPNIFYNEFLFTVNKKVII